MYNSLFAFYIKANSCKSTSIVIRQKTATNSTLFCCCGHKFVSLVFHVELMGIYLQTDGKCENVGIAFLCGSFLYMKYQNLVMFVGEKFLSFRDDKKNGTKLRFDDIFCTICHQNSPAGVQS